MRIRLTVARACFGGALISIACALLLRTPLHALTPIPATNIDQSLRLSCGPAALLALVDSRAPAKSDELRHVQSADASLKTPRTSMYELQQVAHRAGIELMALEARSATLCQLPLPAIARVEPGHFAVLLAIKDDFVYLRGYEGEVQRVSWGVFAAHFSGYALCIRD